MKRGDYLIHVHIQQAKNIRLKGKGTVDPIIEVSVLSEKKYTSSKTDIGPTGVVMWSEHLFFEPKKLEPEDIEEGQISIRVLNKGFFKEDTIGVYEFDVTAIYFMKDHALLHTWLALSNPEGEDLNDITSYIKLSINVSGPGDEQLQLSDDTSVEESKQVMMPASIKKQYKQLHFRILKAEKLPKMDTFGSIDAYLKTTFFRQSLKTSVVTMKDQVVIWDEEMLLPVQWPVASNRLTFQLFDHDTAGSDELVASMLFNLKSVVQEASEAPHFNWVNLYGAPKGSSGDMAKKMKRLPDYASAWLGRILVQYSCEDTKHPEMKKVPLPIEVKQDAAKWSHVHEFEIIAEIGSAICLPDTKKYKIKIAINDFTLTTDSPLESKENYCRYNKRFDQQVISTCYVNIEDLDRIYIYLMDKDDPICYWKGECKDFVDPDPEFKWYPFKADMAVGEVKDNWKAGMFQMKLSINDKTLNGSKNFKEHKAWMKPPPKRLSSWKIRCYIYQCKDLPAADSEGSSDAYIEAWSTDKEKQKTSVVEDNNNPIFFETLEIYADFTSPNEAPPMILNIWDHDEGVFDSDDFIGRSVIFLKDAAVSNDDEIPSEPKWHNVIMGFSQDDPSIGKVLVSFAVVPDDYRFKVPIEYMKLTDYVEFKEYNVEINCLGLRNLQSFGLMPVKKPFIKFNIRSLLPPEKAKAVQNVQTKPQDTGPNPNISTTIAFTIFLPVDPLFCPVLSCDTYDYLYKGLNQPILGTFSIQIGDIMKEDLAKIEEDKQQAIDIINELRKKIEEVSGQHKNGNRSASRQQQISEEIKEEQKLGPGEIEIQIDTENMKDQPSPLKTGDSDATKKMKMAFKKKLIGSSKENNLTRQLKNGIKKDLAEAKAKMDAEAKQELNQQRLKDEEALKAAGGKAHKNVFMPKYQFDERLKIDREIDPPAPSLFIGLGYNEKKEDERKHYRRYHPDELENVKDVMPKLPFDESIIYRGQARGASQGLFGGLFGKANTDETGQVSTIKKVGKFKGIIDVYNSKDKEAYEKEREQQHIKIKNLIKELHKKKLGEEMHLSMDEKMDQSEHRAKFNALMEKLEVARLHIGPYLQEGNMGDQIMRKMMQKTKAIARVYVLEGFNFSQRDIGSFSDPYLKLQCGKKKYNEQDNYQLDQPNPKFYKSYDFNVEFPGAPPLVIQAYDYDDLFGDDIIGETIVDLDDRFFSMDWLSIKDKPVEYRELSISSSTVTQGVIKCWVEILPTEKGSGDEKVWDITPRPIKEYEARVVIWDTKDLVSNDAGGMSDTYFRAFFDTKDSRETDTHYRCSTGKASFNYRLLFNHLGPNEKGYNLSIQAWDRDFFKSNDMLGEATIDLKPLFEDVIETGRSMALNKKYFNGYLAKSFPDLKEKIEFSDDDSFFLTCRGYNEETKETVDNGKVRVSITVLPKDMADANKVGEARKDPNQDPYCPPPTGRISFSLNPFKMLSQLLGPEIMRKVYCCCCCAICLALCVLMFPMIFSNLVSQAMMSIF